MRFIPFKTLRGRAQHPWFHEPNTCFDPDGVYGTSLILAQENAAPLIHLIGEVVSEEFSRQDRGPNLLLPYKHEEDGTVVFKATMKAKDGEGRPRRPKLYDSKGNKVAVAPKIGNGSILRLAGVLAVYGQHEIGTRKGVKAYLNAAKILDLVESDAVDDGFADEEEDGRNVFESSGRTAAVDSEECVETGQTADQIPN